MKLISNECKRFENLLETLNKEKRIKYTKTSISFKSEKDKLIEFKKTYQNFVLYCQHTSDGKHNKAKEEFLTNIINDIKTYIKDNSIKIIAKDS